MFRAYGNSDRSYYYGGFKKQIFFCSAGCIKVHFQLASRKIHYLSPQENKNRVQHGRNIYFTRVIVAFACSGIKFHTCKINFFSVVVQLTTSVLFFNKCPRFVAPEFNRNNDQIRMHFRRLSSPQEKGRFRQLDIQKKNFLNQTIFKILKTSIC